MIADDQVALLFIAGNHSIAAAVEHHSTRVLDLLNDVQSAMMNVQGAAIFSGLRGAPTAEFPASTIQKSAIDCVIFTEDRHEAPLRRKFGFVDKQTHSAFVLIGNYEIRGSAMLERSADPQLLLNSQASAFFPVVAASVTDASDAAQHLSASVVFVNKQKVALLEIDRRAVATS